MNINFSWLNCNKFNIKIISFILFILYGLGDYFYQVDDHIQDLLYRNGHWVLEDPDNRYRLFFYYGIKTGIYFLTISILIYFIFNFKKFSKLFKVRFFTFFLCMIFIPLSVVGFKNITHIDCPYDLDSYGGKNTTCHIFRSCEQSWSDRKGLCFPAGHASGGFALIALRLIFQRKKLMTFIGVLVGFMMGIYQMLRGAHFLGHTLTTFFISLIFVWASEFFLAQNIVNKQSAENI